MPSNSNNKLPTTNKTIKKYGWKLPQDYQILKKFSPFPPSKNFCRRASPPQGQVLNSAIIVAHFRASSARERLCKWHVKFWRVSLTNQQNDIISFCYIFSHPKKIFSIAHLWSTYNTICIIEAKSAIFSWNRKTMKDFQATWNNKRLKFRNLKRLRLADDYMF